RPRTSFWTPTAPRGKKTQRGHPIVLDFHRIGSRFARNQRLLVGHAAKRARNQALDAAKSARQGCKTTWDVLQSPLSNGEKLAAKRRTKTVGFNVSAKSEEFQFS